eukprot:scaffold7468_cov126-Skeletonema_dohrnii-CCMP3373.AAC.4
MCVRKKYAEEDGVSTGSLMGVLCNWTQCRRGGRVDSLLLVTPIYLGRGRPNALVVDRRVILPAPLAERRSLLTCFTA